MEPPPQQPAHPAHNAVHAAMELDEKTPVWPGANIFGPLGLLGLSGVVAEPIVFALRAFGTPWWIAIGLVVAAFLAVLWWTLRNWQRRKQVSEWARNPGGYLSDPAYRLRLIGPGEQNLKVLADLEIDEAFEPLVLRSWSDHRFVVHKPTQPYITPAPDPDRIFKIIVSALVIIGILGGVLALRINGLSFQKTPFPQYHEFIGAAAFAALVHGWLSPAFLRLSPGRLDVIQWRPFRPGNTTCHSYDLKRCRLIVVIGAHAARIEDPDDTTKPLLCVRWRFHTVDSHDWPTMLLRAARTKHETPPLPPDHLVG